MGGSTSSVVQHIYGCRDPKINQLEITNLDRSLDSLRQEIKSRPQAITQGVLKTVSSVEDAVILRYSDLQDKKEIERNVETIFSKFPGRKKVVDSTKRMIDDMQSSRSDQLQGWRHNKKFKDHKGKKIGIEIHYKTKMFEASLSASRDTVVLIAFKCIAHIMDPKIKHRYMDTHCELSESMMSMNIQGMSLEASSYSYRSSGSSSRVRMHVASATSRVRNEMPSLQYAGAQPDNEEEESDNDEEEESDDDEEEESDDHSEEEESDDEEEESDDDEEEESDDESDDDDDDHDDRRMYVLPMPLMATHRLRPFSARPFD